MANEVFDRLATRLREMARAEAEAASGVERWTVRQASPLVIEQLDGELVLEEGDPDFTVGDWLRQLRTAYGIEVGSQVWVGRASSAPDDVEWHALDVVSDAAIHDIADPATGGTGGSPGSVFVQSSPATVWTVPYTGTVPPVPIVIDPTGQVVEPDIDFDFVAKNIIITHGGDMSGRVVLSG